jgi:hypothetical protein
MPHEYHLQVLSLAPSSNGICASVVSLKEKKKKGRRKKKKRGKKRRETSFRGLTFSNCTCSLHECTIFLNCKFAPLIQDILEMQGSSNCTDPHPYLSLSTSIISFRRRFLFLLVLGPMEHQQHVRERECVFITIKRLTLREREELPHAPPAPHPSTISAWIKGESVVSDSCKSC